MNDQVHPLFQQIINVPVLWAHGRFHEDGDEFAFSPNFVDSCDECKGNMQNAIDHGLACAAHPLAYFEPKTDKHRAALALTPTNYCEACDEAGRPDADHGKAL